MGDLVLDAIRIKRKLVDLERYKARLEKIVPKDMGTYHKSDIIVKGAVERNIQLVSDVELDVLMQLYKGLEMRIAADDESIISKFEEKLGKKLVEKIRERRELRNDLIHAYIESDYDKKVFEQAHDLSDIETFSKEVNKLMASSNR